MFRRDYDKGVPRIGTGVSHGAVTAHTIHFILSAGTFRRFCVCVYCLCIFPFSLRNHSTFISTQYSLALNSL